VPDPREAPSGQAAATSPIEFETKEYSMKHTIPAALLALAAVFATTGPALAAGEHAGHGAAPASTSQAMADGVVKKVDKAGNRVTVAHGPLPNGMPAMTMTFPLDKSVPVGQFMEGQKIRFAIEDANGVTKIVRVEQAK
jgi:Cu(I)/Ag(I) efflux system periplasmic protein CusF